MEVGKMQSSQIPVQKTPQTEKAENTEKVAVNEKETGGKTENADHQKYDAVSKDGDTLELGRNANFTNKANLASKTNLSTASTAKLKQMYSQKLISKAVYDKEMKKRASK